LLTEALEKCILLDRTTTADGYGGYIATYKDGAEFDAACVLNSSMEARIAESQGVKSVYTVTTSRALNLQFHDVFRRERDNKVFRVTSDGDDKYTPASATLDMRQVSAEEWVIPNEQG
jgi:hypothetical protein